MTGKWTSLLLGVTRGTCCAEFLLIIEKTVHTLQMWVATTITFCVTEETSHSVSLGVAPLFTPVEWQGWSGTRSSDKKAGPIVQKSIANWEAREAGGAAEISPEKKKLGLALLRAGRVCSPPAAWTMLDLLFSRAALQILTQGHLHNPEPCPPWARFYFFSVEPAEERVERTLSPFPFIPLGPAASVRDLLVIHKQVVLSCRSRQAGRFSFLPLWGFPVCCLDVAVFLVWLPLALSCYSHSSHASNAVSSALEDCRISLMWMLHENV